MYKSLPPEEFNINTNPVITPAGDDPGGLLVQGVDYSQGTWTAASPPGTPDNFRYHQFRSLVGSNNVNNNGAFAAINRQSFKESIHPDTFRLGAVRLKTGSQDVEHLDVGRKYTSEDGNWSVYSDIGLILSNNLVSVPTITCNSEETSVVATAQIYASPSEYNYSTNPSFLGKDDYIRFTEWIDNPVTYITTIGFYNDNGDCLAVTKLPKPFKKDFTTAFLSNVKFSF